MISKHHSKETKEAKPEQIEAGAKALAQFLRPDLDWPDAFMECAQKEYRDGAKAVIEGLGAIDEIPVKR